MNTPYLLSLTIALFAAWSGGAVAAETMHHSMPRTQFYQDQPWLDDKGIHINAHGGGVMYHDGTYYWFGECYRDPKNPAPQVTGVSCYSSTDLSHWKNEGIVLARVKDPAHDLTEGCIMERPKVIHNAKTGKFVLWFHLELHGQGYKAARAGVAVADRPNGPYAYQGSFRLNAGYWPQNVPAELQKTLTIEELAAMEKIRSSGGFSGSSLNGSPQDLLFRRDHSGGQMSRDMTLFVDDDGVAYHIAAAEENGTLHISQLTDDFLRTSGKYARIFPGEFNEAPALFKAQGRYWLVTSGTTGWDPNTARSAVADSIWGPWKALGNPCRDGDLPQDVPRLSLAEWKKNSQPSVGGSPGNNLGPQKTFGGQSTCVFPVQGKPGMFIAMFDVWRPKDQTTSGYIWLPVVFKDDHFTLPWRDTWSLSEPLK